MTKHALLIGINYQGTENQLRGCINDIKNIKSILIDNCDYQPEKMTVITDETQIKPTRQNIENSILSLVQNCLPGDTLFFYYSGHGSSTRDLSNDESDNQDELIVPVDFETSGVITDDWLFQNMVIKVPVGVNLWAFTDCCHSGTILDLKYNYKSLCVPKTQSETKLTRYTPTEWTDKFSFSLEKTKDITGGNICLFSSCLDPQTSAESSVGETFQGAFTYCVIDFFKHNSILMPNGQFRFNNNVKLRNVLKELNCRLSIIGFDNQDSQLSVSNPSDIERVFDP